MCVLSCHVLLGVRRDFSLTWYHIAYRIESKYICCITVVYWSILIDLVILCVDPWVRDSCVLWLRSSVFDKLNMHVIEMLCALRCCVHWVTNYELYNSTTIRSFKGNELMLRPFKGDELTLRPLKGNELKIFENDWGVVYFVQFIDRVCVLKYFLGWTWIKRERPWRTLRSVGLECGLNYWFT